MAANMKTFISVLVFACAVLVVEGAMTCWKQSDCQEDECCVDMLVYQRAFCAKRYQAGNRCSTAAMYKPEKDLYYIACPCVKMYECLGKGTTENGVTVIKDAKCIMPT